MGAMSAGPADARPEKRWIGRSFGAAAQGYDAVAGLQRAVGRELLRLCPNECATAPALILDIGTGTGYCAARLVESYPEARVLALDVSEGMLRVALERIGRSLRAGYLCADAAALPFPDRSIDLVISNLAIQWCPDPAAVFCEFRRVLKPGGRLLFSSFGPETLTELRQAFAAVDRYSHVNDFVPGPELERLLGAAGFCEVATAAEVRSMAYSGVAELMRELKSLGAHNVTAGRPRNLTGRRAFERMIEAYPGRRGDGGIRASFEIILASGARQ
jgi:malonyl-CoA O-methyltransferase